MKTEKAVIFPVKPAIECISCNLLDRNIKNRKQQKTLDFVKLNLW